MDWKHAQPLKITENAFFGLQKDPIDPILLQFQFVWYLAETQKRLKNMKLIYPESDNKYNIHKIQSIFKRYKEYQLKPKNMLVFLSMIH